MDFPESGRSPGEGHGNPLQYSCLENPMDRGAWWAMVLLYVMPQSFICIHINIILYIYPGVPKLFAFWNHLRIFKRKY